MDEDNALVAGNVRRSWRDRPIPLLVKHIALHRRDDVVELRANACALTQSRAPDAALGLGTLAPPLLPEVLTDENVMEVEVG